ncbi:hypothetical protein PC9H_007715 [Pleurotus ostreatus]|uniref:Epoxide hydrolase N-terminal domain-containing protein n=1 Tax=Pleurotus ostreatus TaxID=5322 RepID=A0A8H7DQF6_PLEOS|nr:uncharacterized protein PC9H_007715 [Pleurotus ostreatus]KAF7428491.1 hypothetical protein PC9H_007715 [Pleurotus ostreatus]
MAGYSILETKIDIPQDEIDHFRQMLTITRFPALPIVPGADEDRSMYGTKLSDFKDAKERLLNFDWRKFEAEMNRKDVFYGNISSSKLKVHSEFSAIMRSKRADAIPLLILHGWPFSFWEYKYLIEPLTNPPAEQPAFHVVLPSLPGIFLSSIIPNKQHSTPDVARVFNTLMVDVLGYQTYGAHGGDFGAINLRQVQLNHADTCKLIHFTGFPAPRPAGFTDSDMANLDEVDKRVLGKSVAFQTFGLGYLHMQTTEVATLGYALYDGVGMMSWVVSKYRSLMSSCKVPEEKHEQVWMDQLVNVLLYQYTHSSHTSMLMYKQSGRKYIFEAFGKQPNKQGCPMGISSFDGEIMLAPQPWIKAAGNLIYYKHHPEGGGHIPALVLPEELIEDLREFFAANWTGSSRLASHL